MSMHSRIDPHDEIAWGPNGRASAVPVAKIGPNPLNEEPAGEPPRRQPFMKSSASPKRAARSLKKSHSTTTDRPGATAARASCRAASRSESRSPVSPSWPQ